MPRPRSLVKGVARLGACASTPSADATSSLLRASTPTGGFRSPTTSARGTSAPDSGARHAGFLHDRHKRTESGWACSAPPPPTSPFYQSFTGCQLPASESETTVRVPTSAESSARSSGRSQASKCRDESQNEAGLAAGRRDSPRSNRGPRTIPRVHDPIEPA
jgi:hypothetical protein